MELSYFSEIGNRCPKNFIPCPEAYALKSMQSKHSQTRLACGLPPFSGPIWARGQRSPAPSGRHICRIRRQRNFQAPSGAACSSPDATGAPGECSSVKGCPKNLLSAAGSGSVYAVGGTGGDWTLGGAVVRTPAVTRPAPDVCLPASRLSATRIIACWPVFFLSSRSA